MIIIYHKKNRKILASFPEIFSLNSKIVISGWDEGPESFAQAVLSPEEAYDFEDPRNPKNIHNYVVVWDKNKKVIGLKQVRSDVNGKINSKKITLNSFVNKKTDI